MAPPNPYKDMSYDELQKLASDRNLLKPPQQENPYSNMSFEELQKEAAKRGYAQNGEDLEQVDTSLLMGPTKMPEPSAIDKVTEDYINPAVLGARSFSDAFSFGLTERGATGLSALLLKAMGEDKGKDLVDLYGDIATKQRARYEQEMEKYPTANIVGTMAGFLNPKGLATQSYKLGTKTIGPQIAKQMGTDFIGPNLPKIASQIARRRLGGKVLTGALTGGATSALQQTLDPSAKLEAADVVTGMALGGGSELIGPAAKISRDFISKHGGNLPVVGPLVRTGKEAINKKLDEFKSLFKESQKSLKNISKVDDLEAGINLGTQADNLDSSLNQMWNTSIQPILDKYGNTVLNTKDKADDLLGLVKQKGVRKTLKKVPGKEGSLDLITGRKTIGPTSLEERISYNKKLLGSEDVQFIDDVLEARNLLSTNPTAREVKLFADSVIKPKANYDSGKMASQIERQYRKLEYQLRDIVSSSTQGKMTRSDRSLLDKGMNTYRKIKPDVERLKELTKNDPEKLVQGFLSKTSSGEMLRIAQNNPSMRAPIRDAILNNMFKGDPTNITVKSVLQKIANYGGDEAFSNLVGKEEYQLIKNTLDKMSKLTPTEARKLAQTNLSLDKINDAIVKESASQMRILPLELSTGIERDTRDNRPVRQKLIERGVVSYPR